MFSDVRLKLCVVFLALFVSGCSRSVRSSPVRVAVVPFEDLTSRMDAAWVGQAVSAIAVAQTEGDTRVRTFEVSSLRDAQTSRADQVVLGYLTEASGTITAHASVRDQSTQKTLRSFLASAPSSDLLKLASAVASGTGAPVHDWNGGSFAAIHSFFLARTASGGDAALNLLTEATKSDPSFGAAQVARVEVLMRNGDRAGAAQSLEAARRARLTEPERARLDLAAAQLKGDVSGEVTALTRLASTTVADAQLWRSVAEAQMVRKDYQAADRAATEYLESDPHDDGMLNLRCYARAFTGDLPGARKAVAEYRSALPSQTNPIDTEGEISFYFRQYRDASKSFLEAGTRDSSFLNGAEPFRAALALYLAKDVEVADKLMRGWFDGRRKADALLPLREALWLHMTRRSAKLPDTSAGVATSALWDLLEGNRDKARADAENARKRAANPQEVTLASAALLLAQPATSAEGWQARLNQVLRDPAQSALKEELLGWALLLDRHYAESAQVWRQVWDRSSALAANDTRMLLAWSLARAGKTEDAKKVLPSGWLPPSGLEPGINSLLYPAFPDVRSAF